MEFTAALFPSHLIVTSRKEKNQLYISLFAFLKWVAESRNIPIITIKTRYNCYSQQPQWILSFDLIFESLYIFKEKLENHLKYDKNFESRIS